MREEYKIPGIIVGVGILGAILLGHGLYRYEQWVLKEPMKRFRAGQKPVVAEVLAESYKDSKYILKCRREDMFGYGKEDGIFALSVIDGDSVTKESLDKLIDVGSKISFERGNFAGEPYMNLVGLSFLPEYYKETYFRDDTQAGTKRADRITVLGLE